MSKQVLYGKEARDKVMSGIDKIVKAVAVTLGPMGRNIVISRATIIDYGQYNFPLHITKDGVNTAKAFDLDDPFEKVGILAVKEAAEKTVMQAGDGTTSTCVLLRAIAFKGMELINAGANPMEIKKGIDKAVEYVVEELKKMATPIKGDVEKIRQIATVSANNDSSIGDLIAEAFEKIGEDGIIDLEASNGVKTEIKISDGYKFNKGWLSPLFINKREKQICEYENPNIMLYDKRITHHTQIIKAIDISAQSGKPLVIICEDAEQEGLAFLQINAAQGKLQCCVVTAPDFGDIRRESMEDIATITGGTYISDLKGVGIKDISIRHFGSCKKITISKDETVIIGGAGSKEAVKETLDGLRMDLAEAKTEDDKFPIEKRIAKLSGGVATILVGGPTETEMKERLDRFDDAVRATKAAISEGFVVGGGTAFVRISQRLRPPGVRIDIEALKNIDMGNGDKISWEEVLKTYNQTGIEIYQGAVQYQQQKHSDGEQIVVDILSEPLIQICKNAGADHGSIVKMVSIVSDEHGYNARTNEVENLMESGVIDPVKVLRCSLQNAASAAGMILTSECCIVDVI